VTDGCLTARDADGSWSTSGDREPQRRPTVTGQLADLPSFRRIAGIPFDACMAALESWYLN